MFNSTYEGVVPQARKPVVESAGRGLEGLIPRLSAGNFPSFAEYAKSQGPSILNSLNNSVIPGLSSKYIGSGSLGNSAFTNALAQHTANAGASLASDYQNLSQRNREGDINVAALLEAINRPNFLQENNGFGRGLGYAALGASALPLLKYLNTPAPGQKNNAPAATGANRPGWIKSGLNLASDAGSAGLFGPYGSLASGLYNTFLR